MHEGVRAAGHESGVRTRAAGEEPGVERRAAGAGEKIESERSKTRCSKDGKTVIEPDKKDW
jgi:hypothetical protein